MLLTEDAFLHQRKRLPSNSQWVYEHFNFFSSFLGSKARIFEQLRKKKLKFQFLRQKVTRKEKCYSVASIEHGKFPVEMNRFK